MSLIAGKNVVMYIYDGMWKPIVCGTNCSINTTAETVETSISGQGPWKTFEYGALGWTATFEGYSDLQQTNKLSIADLQQFLVTRTKVLIRYQRTDQSANVYLNEGMALIKSIQDNGPVDGMNSWSVELQGSGVLLPIFVPTPVNPAGIMNTLDYTGVAGEFFFTDGSLNLVDVVDVFVDGILFSPVITAGTPVNKEVKYTSSGGLGRIEVAVPLDAGVQVRVNYQDL